jgi:hypothetical protein
MLRSLNPGERRNTKRNMKRNQKVELSEKGRSEFLFEKVTFTFCSLFVKRIEKGTKKEL